MMKLLSLKPIPAMESPFSHDLYHMGIEVDHTITIMYGRHDDNPYIIICDKLTGQRGRVIFDRKESELENFDFMQFTDSINKQMGGK
jgi:hypothetical protein